MLMTTALAEDKQLQGETQTLEEFRSIEIEVLAADIRVVQGEQWAVSYQLSEKEPLKCLKVENGTLYLETTFDAREYFDRNDEWFVTVTVPEGAALDEVELDTLSGNAGIQGFQCDSASLSSTSGTVEAKQIDARELSLESVSGSVTASAVSADEMEAETVSGEIRLEGAFGEVETDSISGAVEVEGSVSRKGSMESTSGAMTLLLSHEAAVQASSMGEITLNGSKESSPLKTSTGVPVVLKSISGKISVQTAQ